jgi:hypothetical protein
VSRENSWNVRLPKAEHDQWFKNLIDLHELTNHWVRDLKVDRPAHLMSRGLSPEVQSQLWILDTLSSVTLDQLLEETHPEEFLPQLEKTIWTVQSWTLNHILRKENQNLNSPIVNLLEQISWKAGRMNGESRWSKAKNFGRFDLSAIFFALQDCQLSGYPQSASPLIRRATHETVEIELHHCPHQLSISEINSNENLLCLLHSHWCRGFIYTLNQRVSVEHSTGTPRCHQRWQLG